MNNYIFRNSLIYMKIVFLHSMRSESFYQLMFLTITCIAAKLLAAIGI